MLVDVSISRRLDQRAGIEDSVRVERLLDPAIDLEYLGTHLIAQPRLLESSDTMLTGDGAAQ
ncbi:Uncharacterised protein [Mycobacteroides abscessus subsp. abscessus]|nr:Uncharacterised protein [Mycobacteroides abscessus subsp. abscessus]